MNASLFDMLRAGQLPADDASPLPDALARMLSALKPQPDTSAAPGLSVTPVSFGSLAPLPHAPAPSQDVHPSIPNGTTPLSLATDTLQGAPRKGGEPLAKPTISNQDTMGAWLRPIGAFFAGLSGDGASEAFERSIEKERTTNLTQKALMAKGNYDADTALAIATNPQMLQAVLPTLFGTKQAAVVDLGTDPNTGVPVKGILAPNGKLTRINPGDIPDTNGSVGASQGADMSVTGADYLASLSPARAALLKGVLEGRAAPPTGRQLSTPQGQFLMQQLSQAEPGFDLTKWSARKGTQDAFTHGADAQSINNFNTAVNHLGELDASIKDLNNRSFTPWNALANSTDVLLGDPSVSKFDAARKAVLDEVANVFSGKNGSGVTDRAEWEAKLNSSQSPAQLHGVVQELIKLMDGRLSSLADKYNQGMSTSRQPREFLTPASRAILNRLDGSAENSGPLADARAAIAQGASRDAVITRLRQNGIDPAGL